MSQIPCQRLNFTILLTEEMFFIPTVTVSNSIFVMQDKMNECYMAYCILYKQHEIFKW